MKPSTGKICGQCPFRLNAAPGWFGGNSLESYADGIIYDIEVPCHKTQNKSTPMYCTGLAATRVNCAKRAKYSDVIRQSEETVRNTEVLEKVFKNRHSFIEYHEQPFDQYMNQFKKK